MSTSSSSSGATARCEAPPDWPTSLAARGLDVSVIGIPKTIDNDIPFIGQSFGFQTAYTTAAQAIQAARVEAQSAINGVGLVRVMGRHSGFIACYASLSVHHADYVLVPEVPFALEGPGGFLACLHRSVLEKGCAVVVVAEGAGQDLLDAEGADASGNSALADIGVHLKREIAQYFAAAGTELTLKYIDPGYTIRSVPASAHDSVYCVRLAQAAVHAGMAGRTKMVVGRRHNRSSTCRSRRRCTTGPARPPAPWSKPSSRTEKAHGSPYLSAYTSATCCSATGSVIRST